MQQPYTGREGNCEYVTLPEQSAGKARISNAHSGALHKLKKAKIFTAIDARDGSYQMELDVASADATTF